MHQEKKEKDQENLTCWTPGPGVGVPPCCPACFLCASPRQHFVIATAVAFDDGTREGGEPILLGEGGFPGAPFI